MELLLKQNGNYLLELTSEEKVWLEVILERYNAGKGTMGIPGPSGFPLELYELTKKRRSETYAKVL